MAVESVGVGWGTYLLLLILAGGVFCAIFFPCRRAAAKRAAQRRLEASPTRTRIVVSYSRLTEDNSLENLPLLSLVLKRVSKDYPTVVYALERMVCDEKRVMCVLVFSEDKNWVKIINSYESSLEASRDENGLLMSRMNSQPVLLDL